MTGFGKSTIKPSDWSGLVVAFRRVHLGLSWVEVEAAAVEEDGGFEVFAIAVSADSA
ncbi:MAG: hypothetical protein ACI92S_004727, partial [Planctomycetaceae bacterium]